jgi:hypothetical protein
MEEEPEVMAAGAFEEGIGDDLLAAVASGGVASFDPELDEDELLPGARAARAARATGRLVPDEMAPDDETGPGDGPTTEAPIAPEADPADA